MGLHISRPLREGVVTEEKAIDAANIEYYNRSLPCKLTSEQYERQHTDHTRLSPVTSYLHDS